MPSFTLLREISFQLVHYIRPSYRNDIAASTEPMDREDVSKDGKTIPSVLHLQESENMNKLYGNS